MPYQRIEENVLAHGAKGNVVADDTAAFQSAFDAAGDTVEAQSQGRVRIPGGRAYKLTGTIDWPTGVCVLGGDRTQGTPARPPQVEWHGTPGGTMFQTPVEVTSRFFQYMEHLTIRGKDTNLQAGTIIDFRGRGDLGTWLKGVSLDFCEVGIVFQNGCTNTVLELTRVDHYSQWAIIVRLRNVVNRIWLEKLTLNNSDEPGGAILFENITHPGFNNHIQASLRDVNIEVQTALGAGIDGTIVFEHDPAFHSGSQPSFQVTMDTIVMAGTAGNQHETVVVKPASDHALQFSGHNLTIDGGFKGIPSFDSSNLGKSDQRYWPALIIPTTGIDVDQPPSSNKNQVIFAGDVDIYRLWQYGRRALTAMDQDPTTWSTQPINVYPPMGFMTGVGGATMTWRVCTTLGTIGSITATVDGVISTGDLTNISDMTKFIAGMQITMPGEGTLTVRNIDVDAATCTVTPNLAANHTAEAISLVAPVYKDYLIKDV